MADDPLNATGRSRPAQVAPAPPAPARVPEVSRAAPPIAPGPSASPGPEPPAEAARAVVAGSTADTRPAAETPAPTAPEPPPAAYAPALGGPVESLPYAVPHVAAPRAGEADTRSDEERTLLALLRLIDRIAGPGTLSPVERAFVAGAKIMFDQLSKQCREMLKRKPADLIQSMAPPGMTPRSVGNVRLAEAAERSVGAARPAKRRKKPKSAAAKS
jgi:hypothetical protein